MSHEKIWRPRYDIIPPIAIDESLEYGEKVTEVWNHALENGAISTFFQPQIIMAAAPSKLRWPGHLNGHRTLTMLGITGEDLARLSSILEADEEAPKISHAEPDGPIVTIGIPPTRLDMIRKVVRKRTIIHITADDYCDGASDVSYLANMSVAGGIAAAENCTEIHPGPAYEQMTPTTKQTNGKTARKRLIALVIAPYCLSAKRPITVHATANNTKITMTYSLGAAEVVDRIMEFVATQGAIQVQAEAPPRCLGKDEFASATFILQDTSLWTANEIQKQITAMWTQEHQSDREGSCSETFCSAVICAESHQNVLIVPLPREEIIRPIMDAATELSISIMFCKGTRLAIFGSPVDQNLLTLRVRELTCGSTIEFRHAHGALALSRIANTNELAVYKRNPPAATVEVRYQITTIPDAARVVTGAEMITAFINNRIEGTITDTELTTTFSGTNQKIPALLFKADPGGWKIDVDEKNFPMVLNIPDVGKTLLAYAGRTINTNRARRLVPVSEESPAMHWQNHEDPGCRDQNCVARRARTPTVQPFCPNDPAGNARTRRIQCEIKNLNSATLIAVREKVAGGEWWAGEVSGEEADEYLAPLSNELGAPEVGIEAIAELLRSAATKITLLLLGKGTLAVRNPRCEQSQGFSRNRTILHTMAGALRICAHDGILLHYEGPPVDGIIAAESIKKWEGKRCYAWIENAGRCPEPIRMEPRPAMMTAKEAQQAVRKETVGAMGEKATPTSSLAAPDPPSAHHEEQHTPQRSMSADGNEATTQTTQTKASVKASITPDQSKPPAAGPTEQPPASNVATAQIFIVTSQQESAQQRGDSTTRDQTSPPMDEDHTMNVDDTYPPPHSDAKDARGGASISNACHLLAAARLLSLLPLPDKWTNQHSDNHTMVLAYAGVSQKTVDAKASTAISRSLALLGGAAANGKQEAAGQSLRTMIGKLPKQVTEPMLTTVCQRKECSNHQCAKVIVQTENSLIIPTIATKSGSTNVLEAFMTAYTADDAYGPAGKCGECGSSYYDRNQFLAIGNRFFIEIPIGTEWDTALGQTTEIPIGKGRKRGSSAETQVTVIAVCRYLPHSASSNASAGTSGHYITQELLPGGKMLQYDSNNTETIKILEITEQVSPGGHVVIATIHRHRKDEDPWASRSLAATGRLAMSKVPDEVRANAEEVHSRNGYLFGDPTLGIGGNVQGGSSVTRRRHHKEISQEEDSDKSRGAAYAVISLDEHATSFIQGAASTVERLGLACAANAVASERSTIKVALVVQPITSRAIRVAETLGDGRAVNEWVEVADAKGKKMVQNVRVIESTKKALEANARILREFVTLAEPHEIVIVAQAPTKHWSSRPKGKAFVPNHTAITEDEAIADMPAIISLIQCIRPSASIITIQLAPGSIGTENAKALANMLQIEHSQIRKIPGAAPLAGEVTVITNLTAWRPPDREARLPEGWMTFPEITVPNVRAPTFQNDPTPALVARGSSLHPHSLLYKISDWKKFFDETPKEWRTTSTVQRIERDMPELMGTPEQIAFHAIANGAVYAKETDRERRDAESYIARASKCGVKTISIEDLAIMKGHRDLADHFRKAGGVTSEEWRRIVEAVPKKLVNALLPAAECGPTKIRAQKIDLDRLIADIAAAHLLSNDGRGKGTSDMTQILPRMGIPSNLHERVQWLKETEQLGRQKIIVKIAKCKALTAKPTDTSQPAKKKCEGIRIITTQEEAHWAAVAPVLALKLGRPLHTVSIDCQGDDQNVGSTEACGGPAKFYKAIQMMRNCIKMSNGIAEDALTAEELCRFCAEEDVGVILIDPSAPAPIKKTKVAGTRNGMILAMRPSTTRAGIQCLFTISLVAEQAIAGGDLHNEIVSHLTQPMASMRGSDAKPMIATQQAHGLLYSAAIGRANSGKCFVADPGQPLRETATPFWQLLSATTNEEAIRHVESQLLKWPETDEPLKIGIEKLRAAAAHLRSFFAVGICKADQSPILWNGGRREGDAEIGRALSKTSRFRQFTWVIAPSRKRKIESTHTIYGKPRVPSISQGAQVAENERGTLHGFFGSVKGGQGNKKVSKQGENSQPDNEDQPQETEMQKDFHDIPMGGSGSECVDLTHDQEPVIAIFTIHEAGLTVTLHPLELLRQSLGGISTSEIVALIGNGDGQ